MMLLFVLHYQTYILNIIVISFAYLKKQNIPDEKIIEILKYEMMSGNQNAAFFVGGNDMSQNVAAGVAAGNSYTRSRTK